MEIASFCQNKVFVISHGNVCTLVVCMGGEKLPQWHFITFLSEVISVIISKLISAVEMNLAFRS